MSSNIKTRKHPLRENWDYRDGLSELGIGDEEIERIALYFDKGKFPMDIVTIVMEEQHRITLHPDYYPWRTEVCDLVFEGLYDQEVDCERLWRGIASHLERNYPGQEFQHADIKQGPRDAISNILEIYALLRYHDLEKLKK